jgi:hypothetical protein
MNPLYLKTAKRQLVLLLVLIFATSLMTSVHDIGLVAMLAGVSASVFNRVCFNYPTLGDLYNYATYEAILKRDGLVADDNK